MRIKLIWAITKARIICLFKGHKTHWLGFPLVTCARCSKRLRKGKHLFADDN